LHNGDLLRGAAVMTTPTIVTRAGWGARAPRGSVATTTWARRTGVAIHHSAGPTTQTVRSIQDHQMDHNGWQDIGYNWLVTQDGRVWEGRAGGWLAVGAHAANQNTAWIGICWIGNSGSTAPSAAALASIRWLVDEARRLAGRRLDVRGHGQVPGQATECPGSALRQWVAAGLPADELEGDDVSAEDVWRARLPWANDWPVDRWGARRDGYLAQTYLSQGYALARRTDEGVREVLAGQAAILAAIAGQDVAEAAEQAARAGARAGAAEALDELAEGLAERLTEVPAEQVRQAVAEVLRERDR